MSAPPQLKFTDSELVDLAREGQADAISAIYDRYHCAVYGYFRARVLAEPAARELTEQALLRMFDSLDKYQPNKRFDTWLLGFCRELLARRLRGRKLPHRAWTELCLEAEQSDKSNHLEEDTLPLVPIALKEVDESAARTAEMYYREGLPVKQIGAQTAEATESVQQNLVTVRQALRDRIRRHLGGGLS